MKYALLISLIISLLGSCRTDLTEQEIKWIPYTKGEVLVFESSKKELDTIYISDVTSSYTYDCEILNVKCQYLESTTTHPENSDTVNSFLMALTAVKDNNSVLTLNLNRKFALFAPFIAKRLTWLDSMPRTTIETNNGNFKDVLILEPDYSSSTYLDYPKDSILVNKLYWSKSNGLIQFEVSHNKIIWKLKNKYSL